MQQYVCRSFIKNKAKFNIKLQLQKQFHILDSLDKITNSPQTQYIFENNKW